MPVIFPSLVPTQRSFTPGQFPSRTFTALNGQSTTRLYGNVAVDASYALEFILKDTDLKSLLDSYYAAKSDTFSLTLPSTLYNGLSTDIADLISTGLLWFFADPPNVQSIRPGLSRVSVQLKGRYT